MACQSMVKSGLSVILISHKLDEILRVSDRILVLRHGKVVADMARVKANKALLAELIVGRKIKRPAQKKAKFTSNVLDLKSIKYSKILIICLHRSFIKGCSLLTCF